MNVSILDFDPRVGYTSVVAYKIDTHNRVLSINPRVGSRFDAHLSSVGKCLLAFSPGVDLSFYKDYSFPQYTSSSFQSYDALLKEIDEVRQRGYALDKEEREVGLYCIGAPILRYGEAIAAISLSGPTSRIHDSREEERILSLKEVAEQIASGR